MDHERTDAILWEILQDRKTVIDFFDAIFGFLRRRTDFYHIKRDDLDKVGFAKGVREKIVFGSLQRFDPDLTINKLASSIYPEDDMPPPAVTEIEIDSTEDASDWNMMMTTNTSEEPTAANRTTEFSASDYRNGSAFENYCWSQTLKEVELHVKLPPDLKSAKQISVTIEANEIAVRTRTEPNVEIVAGKLSSECKHNDAMWTMEGNKLLITFDKRKEKWWEKLFTHENGIDPGQIECERYIDELPEESQTVLHKLRNEQIKEDSKDDKTQQPENADGRQDTLEQLRKAWDADGSPFKGLPVDENYVKFQ